MIGQIFRDLQEDTHQCDQGDHDGVAVKVFFDYQSYAEVLEKEVRCQDFLNKYDIHRLVRHINEALAKQLLQP